MGYQKKRGKSQQYMVYFRIIQKCHIQLLIVTRINRRLNGNISSRRIFSKDRFTKQNVDKPH